LSKNEFKFKPTPREPPDHTVLTTELETLTLEWNCGSNEVGFPSSTHYKRWTGELYWVHSDTPLLNLAHPLPDLAPYTCHIEQVF